MTTWVVVTPTSFLGKNQPKELRGWSKHAKDYANLKFEYNLSNIVVLAIWGKLGDAFCMLNKRT